MANFDIPLFGCGLERPEGLRSVINTGLGV
jgi:hypothetical protein